jgi:hypothetical protein
MLVRLFQVVSDQNPIERGEKKKKKKMMTHRIWSFKNDNI